MLYIGFMAVKRMETGRMDLALDWFDRQGWQPFPFQVLAWQEFREGKHGLVNAPTGSGKTYSLFIPIALQYLEAGCPAGLFAIWVTPIRALTKEIFNACSRAAQGMGIEMEIAVRTGDTDQKERQRQKQKPPTVLITTPESIHLLLATKGYDRLFRGLHAVVVDEWHELLGNKRGILVELGLSRLKTIAIALRIWGISATIGNLEQGLEVLLGTDYAPEQVALIRADIRKEIQVASILDDEVEKLPWGGHLGIKLLERVIPIIMASESALIFVNTRSQCEIWYQRLLEMEPQLAGWMAMHHSAISKELRDWVEDALYDGRLKAVVCTSSLDLGVDFRPVETIIQIGSPKGIARFIQRAGRSGHRPGASSKIYFVPTHALELMEAPSLRRAIAMNYLEDRLPHIRCFDVLVQYLMTLAVSDGFRPEEIWPEVRGTHCFSSLDVEEWYWALQFITKGSKSLEAYDEFQKVVVDGGRFAIHDRRVALRHRLSIGTIVGDTMIKVRFLRGKFLGNIEEWFISQLQPGDVFWFAGQALEFVMLKDMDALVRKSTKKTGRIPSWQGGKSPLSSQLAEMLRQELYLYFEGQAPSEEAHYLQPLFDLQAERSSLPTRDLFLIEYFMTKEGYHLLMYPFEGRFVHEGMAALIAKRISRRQPISFSIAMNDYGFELLSDKPIDLDPVSIQSWFSTDHLHADIQSSINSVEMARRQFREVARISGMVFAGFPNKPKKEKHLQASAQLLFDVFRDYEPDNLLYRQTYEEVMTYQLEEARLRAALKRISGQKIRVEYPDKITPFAFPIMVERIRERFSTESLTDRIKKMKVEWGD